MQFNITVPNAISFDHTCKIRRAKWKIATDHHLCILSYIHGALALEEKNWGSSVAMGIRCKDS